MVAFDVSDVEYISTRALAGWYMSVSRRECQRLREHIAKYDMMIVQEFDRLGRSLADLAGFVEDRHEEGVDIDLVNQPIGTIGEDDWIAEMTVNTMTFVDAKRKFRLGEE